MDSTQKNTDKYTILIKKADKLFQNEEIEDALELYLEAYDIKPTSIDLLNKLGQSFCCVEDYDKAIKYFKEAINIRPTSSESHFNLGVAYDLIEQFPAAIEAYKKAEILSPKDADILYNIGVDYDFLGNTEKALFYYKKALKLYPKMQEASHNIGVIYLQNFTDLILKCDNFDKDKSKELFDIAYSYFRNKNEFYEIVNNFVQPQLSGNNQLEKYCRTLVEELQSI